jgi:hypothetical protein
MKMPKFFLVTALAAVSLAVWAGQWTHAEEPVRESPTPEAIAFFETHVRPLLVKRCHSCH